MRWKSPIAYTRDLLELVILRTVQSNSFKISFLLNYHFQEQKKQSFGFQ